MSDNPPCKRLDKRLCFLQRATRPGFVRPCFPLGHRPASSCRSLIVDERRRRSRGQVMSEFMWVSVVLGMVLFVPWAGAESVAQQLIHVFERRLMSFSAWLAVL
jgi:hypothetical protein